MKKTMIAGMLLCGGLMIAANGQVASAADGKTEVTAEVTPGILELKVPDKIDFGSQPLSDNVKFDQQEVEYTINDYTGSTSGHIINARITSFSDDEKYFIINGIKVAQASFGNAVIATDKNDVGESKKTTTADLSYTNLRRLGTNDFTVEWEIRANESGNMAE